MTSDPLAALRLAVNGAGAVPNVTAAMSGPDGPEPTYTAPAVTTADRTAGPERISAPSWLAPGSPAPYRPRVGDVMAWDYADGLQVGVVVAVSVAAGLAHLRPLRAPRVQVSKLWTVLVLVASVDALDAAALVADDAARAADGAR